MAAGFTLLGLLFIVSLLGVGMASLGSVWQTAMQREREIELRFVGAQYREAIARFQATPAPGGPRLPKSLDELLSDPRFPYPVRHLRRAYLDPMHGGAGEGGAGEAGAGSDWGLVRDASGGLIGVYSRSGKAPLKRAGFSPEEIGFELAETYAGWVFTPWPESVPGQETGKKEGIKKAGTAAGLMP